MPRPPHAVEYIDLYTGTIGSIVQTHQIDGEIDDLNSICGRKCHAHLMQWNIYIGSIVQTHQIDGEIDDLNSISGRKCHAHLMPWITMDQ